MSNEPFGTSRDPQANPYTAPHVTDSARSLPPLSTGLGSLGQEARLKHLNTAKWIMIVVGILTIGVNGFQFAMVEKMIDGELEKELRKQGVARHQVDPAMYSEVRNTAIRTTKLVAGALIALGVLYIVMGLLVKQYPVPLTITALVLYIGAAAIFAVLDPMTLLQGIIVKVLIVIGLVKAVQAALAYDKARNADIAAQFAT